MSQAALNKKYSLSITDSPHSEDEQKSCRRLNNETKDNYDETDIEEASRSLAADSSASSNNKQTKRIGFQN